MRVDVASQLKTIDLPAISSAVGLKGTRSATDRAYDSARADSCLSEKIMKNMNGGESQHISKTQL